MIISCICFVKWTLWLEEIVKDAHTSFTPSYRQLITANHLFNDLNKITSTTFFMSWNSLITTTQQTSLICVSCSNLSATHVKLNVISFWKKKISLNRRLHAFESMRSTSNLLIPKVVLNQHKPVYCTAFTSKKLNRICYCIECRSKFFNACTMQYANKIFRIWFYIIQSITDRYLKNIFFPITLKFFK